MYWNEPSLYGATFPYRDFPTVPNTMFGAVPPVWQNIPRFIPPTFPPVYGLNQPFLGAHMGLNVPPMQQHINPFIAQHPFLRPFDVPQMRWDVPLQNFYRPFF